MSIGRTVRRRTRVFSACAASGLLLAVLAGCGSLPATSTAEGGSPAPKERKADETAQVLASTRLPEQFVFGGRVWRAHEVHWIEGGASAKPASPPASPTVVHDAPGAPGEKVREDAAPPREPAVAVGKFVPVPGLRAEGHPVYRAANLDEKMTDNIYLEAKGAQRKSDDTVHPETGIAFVEYDAADNLVEKMKLPDLLQATALPLSIPEGTRTWHAAAVQVYDADVFDALRPLPKPVHGCPAFQGEDANQVFIQGEIPEREGAGGGPAGSALLRGPIFIRYTALARAEEHVGKPPPN